MKVKDLLLENPEKSHHIKIIARQMTEDFQKLLPTSLSYLELEVSKYVGGGNNRVSRTAVGINKGVGPMDAVYNHPKDIIVLNNAFDGRRLHQMFEQILNHEMSHLLDAYYTKMQAMKPNDISYNHKPTEINSRFSELVFLLDRRFRGRSPDFKTYFDAAVKMMPSVELNPTSMDNIEYILPPHLRGMDVLDTLPHLAPMRGVKQKTYQRIVRRLHANWQYVYGD